MMTDCPPFLSWMSGLMLVTCLAVPSMGEAVPDDEPAAPPRETTTTTTTTTTAGPAREAPTEIDVELELALLVDASSSVDDEEFALQRQGYVDAFRDPEVQAAVVALDGLVVNYYEWSSYGQRTSAGERLLLTEADCRAMATRIEMFDRHFAHSTNMAQALNAAYWKQKNNRYVSQRQVIDVSGDGICENEYYYRDGKPYTSDPEYGTRWQDVRDRFPDTTTINGISIGSTEGVVDWYDANVPMGTGSFTMNASSFAAFGDAIKQKLLREIAATPISYD